MKGICGNAGSVGKVGRGAHAQLLWRKTTRGNVVDIMVNPFILKKTPPCLWSYSNVKRFASVRLK